MLSYGQTPTQMLSSWKLSILTFPYYLPAGQAQVATRTSMKLCEFDHLLRMVRSWSSCDPAIILSYLQDDSLSLYLSLFQPSLLRRSANILLWLTWNKTTWTMPTPTCLCKAKTTLALPARAILKPRFRVTRSTCCSLRTSLYPTSLIYSCHHQSRGYMMLTSDSLRLRLPKDVLCVQWKA